MIRVRIQDEVLDYLRRLTPKPRRAMRLAIKELTREKGDIKPLTDGLEGFHRLRVGSQRVITCVYAGPRKWIYEVFHSRLLE